MANIIDEARLVCVNIGKSNNKYYNIFLYDNQDVQIVYGRIVEGSDGKLIPQSDKTFHKVGRDYFEKKKHEKLRPRSGSKEPYVEQKVIKEVASEAGQVTPATTLEQIALEQIQTNSDEVKKLIKYLSQCNIHNITSNTKIQYNSTTGLFTTAFGLITKEGLDEARNLLSAIKTNMENNQFGQDFENNIDSYLRIIPRTLGRQKVAYTQVFPSIDDILKQNDILDALESSLVELKKPKENKDNTKEELEKIFDVTLGLVTDSNEQSLVESHYYKTAKDMHAAAKGFKVSKVYKVDIKSMSKAYHEKGKSKGEEKRLWHGSSPSNILSILRSGFQITPPATAHIAGKAYGHGIYTAINSSKSMGYATSFWGGRGDNNKAFMFLNDVALGKFYVPRSSTSQPPPQGYDSYWAQPTQSGVLNDEIVIFDPSQMNPVYLVELTK